MVPGDTRKPGQSDQPEVPEPRRPALVSAAKRAGWQLNPPVRAMLRDLDAELRSLDRPTVAVLTGPRGRRLDRIIAEAHPGTRVVRVDPMRETSATHVALAAHGPFDVLVDDTRPGGKVKRFREIFGHVRSGGVLLMRCPPTEAGSGEGATGETRDAGLRGYLARLVERPAADTGAASGAASRERAPELVLAESLGSVAFKERHILARNKLGLLAKMREDEMNAVIELRSGARARLLDSRPPREFTSQCTLRQNVEHHNHRIKQTYVAPMLSLREYDDVVCVPGQVAVQGNLLLPDTYRHNQQNHLNHRFTHEATPRFARVMADISAPRPLPGTYYYLDNELRGHFGHTMTEQMAKVWAWPMVRAAHPDVRGLLSFRRNPGRVSETEVRIFGAAGIDEDRLVTFEEPVLVEKLISATAMFSMPAYVHPDIRESWQTIGRALAAEAPERPYPKRIFCARRIRKRSCRNAAQVEQQFAAHGFEVVYPEEFPLAEQARMFREADVVAGFAGSGLFTLSFCESPKRVIMISSESYTAINEYLISSVLGHEIDLFWCAPALPQPDSGYRKGAFESDFSFDFERDGDRLRKVLSST